MGMAARTPLHRWLQALRGLRSDAEYWTLLKACAIGAVSAFAALALKQGIDWIGGVRLQLAERWGEAIALPLAGLVLGGLAGTCIRWLSPAAGGGGIPQVKAVLAHYAIPLSLRVALVKMLGTIATLGGGLTLGRRGPTVHIGAALAAQLADWGQTPPEHRRQIVAAGAASGIAAGFNTPIAGIVFAIEELMRDVSRFTLEIAILASFTGAFVAQLLGGVGPSFPVELAAPESAASLSAAELPFYLLLGGLAGLLGGAFNRGILWGLRFNRNSGLPLPARTALAGAISGAIAAFLPTFFRFNAGLDAFWVVGEAGLATTALAFAAQFLLTLLAYGSGAPGGLFTPALVLGSVLGYLVGSAQVALLDVGAAHTYALVGMGAFFTAVVRVPATAIIIVFEITSDFDLVLPLMVGSVVAYTVAERLFRGSLYQHLLAANGIQLDDEMSGDRDPRAAVRIASLVRPNGLTLSGDLTLERAREVLAQAPEPALPVVWDGNLLATLTPTDAARLGPEAQQRQLRDVLSHRPVAAAPDTPLNDAIYLMDRYALPLLPVVRDRRFVGTIGRADVIRAEARRLRGQESYPPFPAAQSYCIYRTRAPSHHRRSLLLPVADATTLAPLVSAAATLAQDSAADLDCLHAVTVPPYRQLQQSCPRLPQSRQLLRQAAHEAWQAGVAAHAQVRIAYRVVPAILEALADPEVKGLVLGWRGQQAPPIAGSIPQAAIRQVRCEVVAIKPAHGETARARRELVLVPGQVAGWAALERLPALAAWRPPEHLQVCQVRSPQGGNASRERFERAVAAIRPRLPVPPHTTAIRARSLGEAAARWLQTRHWDVVVFGLSWAERRQGLPRLPPATADSTVVVAMLHLLAH
ncbi:MAG: chloride channel protein [Cyanobacteria bacterium QS_8_64_29]|nr:MAG: chloride channel protein [Cyanobacteria bacterium QS_8_64_29]